MSQTLHHTDHSRVRRAPKRASYDLHKVLALANELKMAHLGFINNDRPVIIPITVWVHSQNIYFHVANKSRLQKMLEARGEICVSIAQCDEWVMSKSAYHHSANYRSAVLFCTGQRVTETEEFNAVFKTIINDLEADRWSKVREPSKQEQKATALMKLIINEGSYKSRSGAPNEDPGDLDLPVWNGTISACPFNHQTNE